MLSTKSGEEAKINTDDYVKRSKELNDNSPTKNGTERPKELFENWRYEKKFKEDYRRRIGHIKCRYQTNILARAWFTLWPIMK